MTRTRRSDCASGGWTRRRQGRGFSYRDERRRADHGRRVCSSGSARWRSRRRGLTSGSAPTSAATSRRRASTRRAAAVPLPPGLARRRDQAKFDEMLVFAARAARAASQARRRAWRPNGMGRERVLACAIRLLDLGFFRVGGETYAEQNATYGLATVLKRHVAMPEPGVLVFDYPAKHGLRRVQRVIDPATAEIVTALRRRRGGGEELLAYKDGARWRDVRSDDINAHLKVLSGPRRRLGQGLPDLERDRDRRRLARRDRAGRDRARPQARDPLGRRGGRAPARQHARRGAQRRTSTRASSTATATARRSSARSRSSARTRDRRCTARSSAPCSSCCAGEPRRGCGALPLAGADAVPQQRAMAPTS